MASRSTPPRRTSEIWSVFADLGDTTAKCNLCSKCISYKGGSTCNLHRHHRNKHPTVPLPVKRVARASTVNISEEYTQNDTLYLLPVVDTSPAISEQESMPQNNISISTVTRQSPKIPVVKTEQYSMLKDDENIFTVVKRPRILEIPSIVITEQDSVPQDDRTTSTAAIEICPPNQTHSPKPPLNRRGQEIDFALLETLVKDYLPFSIVESKHFQKFLGKLNPGYRIPTKEIISKAVLQEQYIRTKQIVKAKIQFAEAIALTTEGWTSIRNEHYMSVTAHYVKDLELQSSLLECFKYDEKHTSEDLAEELRRVTMEWGIENKVVCVVCDNVANIVAAAQLTTWNHIHCFAHTLNSVLQNGLEHIQAMVNKVKKVVEFFKRSSHASIALKQMQKDLKEPILTLKWGTGSRWISTLDMLQRTVDVKDSLMSVITTDYPDLSLTADDITTITQACKVLKVFKDCIEEMSREQQVTASKVILLSQSLKRWCCKFTKNTDICDDVQQLAEQLVEELNKLLRGIEKNDIYAEATLLDPRFKLHGFSNKHFGEKAKQNLIRHCEKYVSKASISTTEVPAPTLESESCLWAEFDEVVSALHPRVAAALEVDTYLQEPLLQRKENPFHWWSERQSAYPALYDLAKKRLCIVASSSPCEIMFSKSGYLLTERRNRLTGKRIEKIIFLNRNL